jgi:hypothetical protein
VAKGPSGVAKKDKVELLAIAGACSRAKSGVAQSVVYRILDLTR